MHLLIDLMVELIVNVLVFGDGSELVTGMRHTGNGGLIVGVESDLYESFKSWE